MVGDGIETSNTAHTTIAVTAVNDAPVAQAGSASGNEDTTIFGNAVATDDDNYGGAAHLQPRRRKRRRHSTARWR